MYRTIIIAACLFALLASPGPWTQAASSEPSPPVVLVVRLEGDVISPITVRFIERALQEARDVRAACLIIELDTPGGLVDSTRQIVREILTSPIPVVVYVSPSSARAASAGVFITLASHVAAMAPATHIGAARPVQIGGLPIGPQTPPAEKDGEEGERKEPVSAMEEKVVNDTRAWIRSLAELRGRNVEWAELAVTESRSITDSEAIEKDVIDLVAVDLDDLLTKIDGREVSLPDGKVQLAVSNATVRVVPKWWGERLLAPICNPNVAFLMLIFGFYGVLFELYSPGWGVAGTLGAALLLLGCVGLSMLPLNYGGVALLVLGLGMFVAEVFVVSYGALTFGGIICLVLGGLMMVDSPAGFVRVSTSVVLPVAIATGLITVFVLGTVLRSHRSRVQTGIEGMLGQLALAVDDFHSKGDHYEGTVSIHGELWHSVSSAEAVPGQPLEVKGQEGLTLLVEPTESNREGPPTSDRREESENTDEGR